MPWSLNIQQVIFLLILFASFGLFLTERLRNDLVAVLIILALAIGGVLSPSEALSGFGSEPAVIVVSIFISSGAIHRTGLSDAIGAWIGRLAGNGYSRVLAVIMLSWYPIGHHGNLLVYGPGRYRFYDFTKVGAPADRPSRPAGHLHF